MLNRLSDFLAKLDVHLSPEVVAQEIVFLDELLRWNERVNLTSIRNRDESLEKHLVDSLFLLKYLPKVGRLLDMGSGGGLPGIPLAIACPSLQVVSVDSVGKKINFQKHIKRLLSLENLLPLHIRLELLDQPPLFDFVVARALSSFSMLTEWSAPLMSEGGSLVLMKGPEGEGELEQYLATRKDNHYKVKLVDRYQLPESLSERQIIVLTRNSHEQSSLR